MNLNLHFHVVHLDGLYDRGADGALRFFQTTPSTADIEGLVVEIALACERWLAKQGFGGDDEDSDPGAAEDDAQATLQLASLSGSVATGDRAGRTVRKVQRLGGRDFAFPPRCAAYGGYNIHCAGRRMAERAAHWIDRVIPPVATRQWVITVPWARRWLLARRPDLATGVLRAAVLAWVAACILATHLTVPPTAENRRN